MSARVPGGSWRSRSLAGWLFADLMAAFVLIALGTQVVPPLLDQPEAVAATPSAAPATRSPSPSPTAARTRPAGMLREYVRIELRDTSSAESIRRTIAAHKPRVLGRRAGMVLTFGRGGPGVGEAIARGVNEKLPRVDRRLFGDAVFRDFNTTGGITNIEIYFYPT